MGGSFDVAALAWNLTDDPSEGDHLDPARPALAQSARRGVRSRAARVDVVDEAYARRRSLRRGEPTGDVAPTVGQSQPTLARSGPRSGEQGLDRERPALAELTREPLGRLVPALEPTPPVGWDERERSDVGYRELVRDSDRRGGGECTKAALLPAPDEATHSVVVRDRRSRRGERKAAARAFGAALDGPLGRLAAAGAERRAESPKGVAAVGAQLLARRSADDAAHGQDQV
jgi:hypothetical protein